MSRRTPQVVSARSSAATSTDAALTLSRSVSGDGSPPVTMGPLIVRPSTALEAFRHNEYDADYAIGEMVDNSLESGAKNVWIEYTTAERQQPHRKSPISVVDKLVVIDDGSGMSPEVLTRALVLGESIRPVDRRLGIGRFGVGLTMGGLSLARSITVISRASIDEPFFAVTLDLDELRDSEQTTIAPAVEVELPAEYVSRLEDSTGTIVILEKCDRLQVSPENERTIKADDVIKGIPNFLGRTYRKFIAAGRQLWFEDKQVFLHDPLYLMSPTMHDVPELDLKATLIRTEMIDVPIPGRSDGATAPVTVTVTLLPERWRESQGAGGSADATKRHIPDNQGVSILRADREVLYGQVPYLIGAKGQAQYQDKDRFWSCEIAFSPELDELFEVRFIKRGAQPRPELRNQIRTMLSPTIKTLREEITRHWSKKAADKAKGEGVFVEAEEVMNAVAAALPKSRRKARPQPPADEPPTGTAPDGSPAPAPTPAADPIAKIAEEAAAASAPENTPEREEVRERTAQRLASNWFSIVPVDYPENFFFETEHHLGKVIVKLNIRHPFYREIFVPLCGPLTGATEDNLEQALDPVKRRARIAVQLMLMSYAQAESMFDDNEELFANLRGQWGMALGAAVKRMPQFVGTLETSGV